MQLFKVLAHEGEEVFEIIEPSLDQIIRTNSVKYTLIAIVLLSILTVISLATRNKSEFFKYLLFGGFVLISLLTTLYLGGSTIYLNQKSVTGGPVHYHADFEIYNCGEKVELKDPQGLSNKIGSEVVHEHNDDRIHIEGVILDEHDASIGHFIKQIGGELRRDHLIIPAEDGLLELENGQRCDGQVGSVQVFVYQTEDQYFTRQKLTDPEDYIISSYGQVPPGDCIIIEFGPQKEKTDKLCNFYKIAIQKGELKEQNGN
ncbi:hypothetical protein HYZ05_03470 [Candidatus Daviesbacteria bacterium]|nr:hypothetical protein [Candidatus Daviesbacteria bacterium]